MNEEGNARRLHAEYAEYAVLVSGVRVSLPERSVVGRAVDTDVRIATDPRVSRRHARLTVCAHGVVIEDLASKGGVYVDGQRIEQGRLLLGGENIRLGTTVFQLLRTTDNQERAAAFDEKTAVSSRRAPADSGYFAVVDEAPRTIDQTSPRLAFSIQDLIS
jgi:pSer/pThr/pTyr-binding forkhead associated (FHA) protein